MTNGDDLTFVQQAPDPFVCHSEAKPKNLDFFEDMKQYYVYIMTNRSKTLYTGVSK